MWEIRKGYGEYQTTVQSGIETKREAEDIARQLQANDKGSAGGRKNEYTVHGG